jgi:hypothetical protein
MKAPYNASYFPFGETNFTLERFTSQVYPIWIDIGRISGSLLIFVTRSYLMGESDKKGIDSFMEFIGIFEGTDLFLVHHLVSTKS